MVRSMFADVAGLRTHQSKLDVIGNNIANVNTWGYKAGSANFMDALYTNTTNSTGGNSTVAGGLGGINASQVGYGVRMSSISRDFSKSTPYQTGHDLDIMIDGTGFLIVRSSSGAAQTPITTDTDLANAEGVSLSRVGILTVDNEGYLVDSNGYYVYGFQPGTPDQDGNVTFNTGEINRIRIPNAPDDVPETDKLPADAEGNVRYKCSSYRIMSDGTVVGYTQGERKVTMGKIALAGAQNVNGLQSTSGYYYQIGDNTGACTIGESGAILGSILSGYLEMPNVDLAKEFSEMITTQRGYQANTKIITVTDEMLQELVNMKR